MKTLEQIKKEYKSNCLDGRDITRLMQFFLEEDLKNFGLELKEEFIGKHEMIPFTRENILIQLKSDLEFAFEKLSLHKLFITAYFFDKKKCEYFDNRYKYQFSIEDDVFYKGKFWDHYYYSYMAKQYFERINKGV